MSRQIAVIGLGLIGGSIAMGLKEFEDFKRVGVDVSQPTLRYALEQGIVDQVCEDPREAWPRRIWCSSACIPGASRSSSLSIGTTSAPAAWSLMYAA